MNPRRVVVTGLGAITSIGRNQAEFWENLIAGRTGIGPFDLFDPSGFRVRIAAQVRNFSGTDYSSRREIQRLSRADLFGLISGPGGPWGCRPGIWF